MNRVLLCLLCATAILFAAEEWPRQGTVTGKELTIRAKAGLHYDSLGNFRRGEKVTIVSRKENWYEVQLPDRIEAWIAADAIDENGEVLQDKCPLYAGPGIMFTDFAQVTRGTKLQLVANEIIQWRLVKVPPTATAWVNSAFVQLDELPQEPENNQEEELQDAQKRQQDAQERLAEAQAAAEKAEKNQAEAELKLKHLLDKLATVELAAKEAEEKRAAAEQKLKENTEKADAAARAAELALLKQATLEQEKNTEEFKKAAADAAALKKQIEDLQKQLDEKRKDAESQIAAKNAEIQKLDEEIAAKKAELLAFRKPEVFEGVVDGLGAKATASASHVLYDANRRPICFLYSKRIQLNDWTNKRVSLSGNIQHPDGWQLPLVHVTDIIVR